MNCLLALILCYCLVCIEANGNVTKDDVITEASTAGLYDSTTLVSDTIEETIDLDAPMNETKPQISEPFQSGPFVDLFGPSLLSLTMIDSSRAKVVSNYTNDLLQGKSVVGVYFSADWCGPCRKFTPELVQFYEKMKSRRGKANSFEIIWVSRCRDVKSYEQYFTHMKWPALPPDQAMGQRGQMLFEKYKVKGIPSLVLLDDVGNVITLDARNKIPQDKAGIGFPWRNPLSTLYLTFVPKSLRYIIKAQMIEIQKRLNLKLKSLLPVRKTA